MSIAPPTQSEFTGRIDVVREALSQDLLIDKALTDLEHNQRARVLRNGLMLTAFTALEDFVRGRVSELLRHISRTVLSFDDLPEKLRFATVIEAMRASHDRAKMAEKDGEDGYKLAQGEAAAIASTAGGGPLSLSKYSLGYAGSNVSSEEVGGILGALQINNPWKELTELSARCGASYLDLKAEFDTGRKLRNSAAHDPRANIPSSDLEQFCFKAKAIALGFDLLGSHTTHLLHKGDPTVLGQKLRPASTVQLFFIDEDAKGWAVRSAIGKRALAIKKEYKEAISDAVARTTQGAAAIVERDSQKLPISWRPQC